MASSISLMRMYSSAVWLRVLSPGPIFIDGQGMRAWSLRVGLPKGVRPRAMALCRRGWSGEMGNQGVLLLVVGWLRTLIYRIEYIFWEFVPMFLCC